MSRITNLHSELLLRASVTVYPASSTSPTLQAILQPHYHKCTRSIVLQPRSKTRSHFRNALTVTTVDSYNLLVAGNLSRTLRSWSLVRHRGYASATVLRRPRPSSTSIGKLGRSTSTSLLDTHRCSTAQPKLKETERRSRNWTRAQSDGQRIIPGIDDTNRDLEVQFITSAAAISETKKYIASPFQITLL
jgi:hypothetical protein